MPHAHRVGPVVVIDTNQTNINGSKAVEVFGGRVAIASCTEIRWRYVGNSSPVVSCDQCMLDAPVATVDCAAHPDLLNLQITKYILKALLWFQWSTVKCANVFIGWWDWMSNAHPPNPTSIIFNPHIVHRLILALNYTEVTYKNESKSQAEECGNLTGQQPDHLWDGRKGAWKGEGDVHRRPPPHLVANWNRLHVKDQTRRWDIWSEKVAGDILRAPQIR